MGFKQEVANGIVESIADLRKGDDLEDFTVIVDGVSVRCHRFILGACSLFFRAMFRSGMRENKENCVTLKSVSHPTFTQILTALYTGHDILSEENVFEVWRAAHMLEIGFLLEECEMFLKQNISTKNYEKIYENAKLLDSDLLEDVHNFMLNNFDTISTSQTFLELSVSEIKALIDSDELVVSSEDNVVKAIMRWISYVSPLKTGDSNEMRQDFCKELPFYNDNGESEDDNISIGDNSVRASNDISATGNDNPHVEKHNAKNENNTQESKQMNLYGDSDNYPREDQSSNRAIHSGARCQNEMDSQKLEMVHQETQTAMLSKYRQEHLLTLVSAVRSCLLSPDYLEILLSNPSIINNALVRDEALLKAVYYQLRIGRRHGQWPSAAFHRYCSSLKNVVVWTHRRNGSSRRDENVWGEVIAGRYTANFKTVSGNLVNFDNELYELTDACLYVFRNGIWNVVLNCRLSQDTIMIAVGNSIFFFSGDKLSSVNPRHHMPQLTEHKMVSEASGVTAVTSFENLILVFGSHISEQNDQETVVHTFDPSNGMWKKLENIQGPAKDLISFCTDKKTFLLQTNGSCWNVTSDGNGSVIITFNGKAWDYHWDLYGAVTYRNKLLIGGGMQHKKNRSYVRIPGESLNIWFFCSATRVSFTPIIMEKKYFTEKKT